MICVYIIIICDVCIGAQAVVVHTRYIEGSYICSLNKMCIKKSHICNGPITPTRQCEFFFYKNKIKKTYNMKKCYKIMYHIVLIYAPNKIIECLNIIDIL